MRVNPRFRYIFSIMPFSNLGLDAKILQAVSEAGYTEPTPIQPAAILFVDAAATPGGDGRTISVRFNADVYHNMPWRFGPAGVALVNDSPMRCIA